MQDLLLITSWQVLHGMNAERCLLAGEALGLGFAALDRATKYARDRVIFGRPIGQNQGIAHPLATAYMGLEAAKLATYYAARLYDNSTQNSSITQQTLGVACNTAKYLAAEAAFTACERAVSTSNLFRRVVLILIRFWCTGEWATPETSMSSVI